MKTVGGQGGQQAEVRLSHRFRLGAELLLVIACATAVCLLAYRQGITSLLPSAPTHLVVYLAIAGSAAAGAILASQIARVTRKSAEAARLAAIAAALGTYAIAVVPFSTALFATGGTSISLWAGQLVAHVTTLALLIVALVESRARWLHRWPGLALATGIAIGAAALGTRWPWIAALLLDTYWLPIAIFAGWIAVAIGFAVDGMRRRQALTWRIGLGLLTLNASQLVWMFSEPPDSATAYAIPSLQALAIGSIVIALVWRLRAVMAAMRRHQRDKAEQALASMRALRATQERTAVRDHEIRNLVAGLSGVSHLLDQGSASSDTQELGTALEAELQRLRRLVDGGTASGHDRSQVTAVLRRLVMLHRANGMQVELDAEPGLVSSIRPSALTQALTNVLSNCGRHAPDAAVYIRAHLTDDSLRIEVHDDGPGIPSGDSIGSSTGCGLGLFECCELLDACGGSMRLGNSDRLGGALVTLDLAPAAVLEPQ